ncbi:unnamed protein product [marine sediment metagenome]|uniref:Uncharacterized protein n=1 Tax=marine sediment metagenome TaxID=412755 RepID=X0ULR5_9ZZZZ
MEAALEKETKIMVKRMLLTIWILIRPIIWQTLGVITLPITVPLAIITLWLPLQFIEAWDKTKAKQKV